MRICLVGDHEDLSAAYVGWLAEQRGADVVVLREDRLGLDWTYRASTRSGLLELDAEGRTLRAADVGGAFVRLNPKPAVAPELGVPDEAEHVYAMERRSGLQWLLEQAPFAVVNRPSAGRANASKPLQMRLLAAAGLAVPRWIATNDPDAAASFLEAVGGDAVYKACSGVRSHVRRADDALLERLADGTAPVVLQQYVAGSDVRVHVVGERVFATEIRSAAVDYRFDGGESEYIPVRAPAALERRCRDVAAAERLELAGFDFRLASDGRWWCLEVNPVPTFLPYEAAAGHPIGDAVVDLLLPGTRSQRRVSPLAAVASSGP